MLLGISSGLWTLFTLLLGGSLTLIGTLIANWNRRSVQNQQVRSALQNEVKQLGAPLQRLYIVVLLEINPQYNIRSVQEVDFDAVDVEERQQEFRRNIASIDESYVERVFSAHYDNLFSTDVYEANVGDIGIFTQSESETVISFYTRLNGIYTLFEDNNFATDSEDGDGSEPGLPELYSLKSFLESTLQEREDCIEVLDKGRGTLLLESAQRKIRFISSIFRDK
ncbi:hypothetical protein SAMN05421858_4598 [Haladaptatus litoreus]|uniref:Uncharacterized protein n=1 Tax=Haladaptatus litoreus TaxID=553468 RepID=A0A1N7EXA7_9EURY|nr:hypothetical protein [Haladaptatus litoreus]SIR92694.1 hypothetical protein SAMN05421858_4598 [Haladaptatus litoreus]